MSHTALKCNFWHDKNGFDHINRNAPVLIRTPKLTRFEPAQYWGGGPPGNSVVLNPFFLFFVFIFGVFWCFIWLFDTYFAIFRSTNQITNPVRANFGFIVKGTLPQMSQFFGCCKQGRHCTRVNLYSSPAEMLNYMMWNHLSLSPETSWAQRWYQERLVASRARWHWCNQNLKMWASFIVILQKWLLHHKNWPCENAETIQKCDSRPFPLPIIIWEPIWERINLSHLCVAEVEHCAMTTNDEFSTSAFTDQNA